MGQECADEEEHQQETKSFIGDSTEDRVQQHEISFGLDVGRSDQGVGRDSCVGVVQIFGVEAAEEG